jgi:Ca2+-binding RTX toxin-like protein
MSTLNNAMELAATQAVGGLANTTPQGRAALAIAKVAIAAGIDVPLGLAKGQIGGDLDIVKTLLATTASIAVGGAVAAAIVPAGAGIAALLGAAFVGALVGEFVGDAIGEVYDRATPATLEQTMQAISDFLRDTGDAASDAGEVLRSAFDAAVQALGNLGQGAVDAAHTFSDMAGEVTSQLATALADAFQAAANAVGDIPAALNSALQNALDGLGDLAGDLTDAAEALLDQLGAQADALFGELGDLANSLTGMFGPAGPLGGLGSALAGLFGPDGPLGDLASALAPNPSWLPPFNPLAPLLRDPLVVDLDGDGFDLIDVAHSVANFDLDGNGFAERVGWVHPDDGFLVADANGNGQVDGVQELFGNATTDGFDALRQLDTNGDGSITSADAAFATLRVWRDLNGDGQSQSGELSTLASYGLTSINLAAVASQAEIKGNHLGFTSSASINGADHTIASTYFATNALLSVWQAPANFEVSDEAWMMPELLGYGRVKDLASAMTLDPSLLASVQGLISGFTAMTPAQLDAAFQSILLKWTGADQVSASGRGANVDGRHLAVIEAFYDAPYQQPTRSGPPVSDPDAFNGRILEQLYHDIVASLLKEFMTQAPQAWAHLTGDVMPPGFEIPLMLLGAATASSSFSAALEAAGAAIAPASESLRPLAVALTVARGARVELFGGDSAAYTAAVTTGLAGIDDQAVRGFASVVLGGAPSLFGAAGSETISGTAVGELFVAGSGDDSLAGGDGNDSYVWARGDGADVITDAHGGGYGDKLLLIGVNPADVSLVRSGNDVTLVIAPSTPGGSDGGSIKLIANLAELFDRGVDQIVFADGSTWTSADLRVKLLAQASTAGNDSITGFNTNDTITGGVGNDSLAGGDGDDRYVWARGHGADTVTDLHGGGYGDKLVLTGINPADVSLVRNGNDVTLTIAPSTPGGTDGGTVKLIANLDDYFDRGVDQIVFADGTIWTGADLRSRLLPQGTTGADSMVGFNTADALSGAGGNDTITGAAGNDTITGGAGNDSLAGGNDDDRYVWARGDGADTISDGHGGGYGDKLVLTGINPADVSLVRSGNDVTLVIAPSTAGGTDGGSIKLIANVNENFDQGVDQIIFGDGTIWTGVDIRARVLPQGTPGPDTLVGTNSAEALDSGAGNDSINSAAGNDTVTGGAGDDSLAGGNDDDSYVWARGDGADIITDAHGGGYGDKLLLIGVNPADVSLVRSGNDVTLVIAPSTAGGTDGGSIKLVTNLAELYDRGVDQIVFADGSIWTSADLRVKLLAQAATAGNDSITGFNSNDTITGGAGNDSLAGGDGDDRYVWARGDGADTITDGHGGGYGDKLVLTGVNPADVSLIRSGNDVTLVIAPSTAGGTDGGSIKLIANLDDYFDRGVDQIIFGDGSVWTEVDLRSRLLPQGTTGADSMVGFNAADALSGAGGNDTITGAAGNDTIAGGAGDDSLAGGNDDDQYVWARGDGADIITDDYTGGYGDKLVLTGINPADVSLVRSGIDVTLVIAPSTPGGTDGGSIKLTANLDELYDRGVDQIRFADGSIWTSADLRVKVLAQAATAGNDSITGFNTNDAIAGGVGNDSLSGGSGNDSLSGEAGVDTLTGGAGADRFMYASASEAPVGAPAELITDFSQGSDKIDLSAIDANAGAAGDQAFVFIGTAAFSSVAGELRFEAAPSGARTIYGDLNGDGIADFQIQLTGASSLVASDFLL